MSAFSPSSHDLNDSAPSMISDTLEPSTLVWCHICCDTTTALRNAEDELECTLCQGTFVEEAGQDVESFLALENESNIIFGQEVQSSTVPSLSSSNDPGLPNFTQSVSGAPSFLSQLLSQFPISNSAEAFVDSYATRGAPQQREIHVHAAIAAATTGVPQIDLRDNQLRVFGLISSLSQVRGESFQLENRDALGNADFERFLHHVLMNENSHAGAPAASDDLIASLSTEIASESSIAVLGECSISQECFEAGETVVSLPCGHRFKQDPIEHWLRLHRTCPVCRVDITDS